MPRLLLLVAASLLLAACTDVDVSGHDRTAVLSVSGQAEVRAAPDQARFTAAVVNDGATAEATLNENARSSEALLNALKEAGLAAENLRSTGVHLQPMWSSRPRDADPDWRPRITGYQARNQIEVTTTDLAGVGTLLAAAVRAGATDLGGLSFQLADDAAAREEAIQLATERALREARTLAAAANTETGAILELRLDGAATQPPPMLRSAMMDGRMEMSSVPVEPGEVTVTAHVTVTFALD